MGFPLHKEWMGESSRLGDVYREGVAGFLRYATHNTSDEIFSCPCVKCNNGSNKSPELIELHLIKWGMRKDYTLWDFHGETDEFPYVPEHVQNDEGLESDPTLNDLNNDVFGVHEFSSNMPNEFVDGSYPQMKDVHCSGRLSNTQVAKRLKKEGKPYTRTHVSIEVQRQKKNNGEIHPEASNIVGKVQEVQRSQEENSFVHMSLDEDPLGQVCGPESRGRVRGEGTLISKTDVDHFAYIQPKLAEFTTQKSDIQDLKEIVALLQGSVNTLIDAIKMVKDNNSNTQGLRTATGSATATPSARSASMCSMTQDSFMPLSSPIGYNTPQSIKLEKYHLYGFSHSLPIALGEANPEPTLGTLVHTRPLTEYERRVNIVKVMDGMENEPLYMHSQAGTTIIGDCVGAFVVWPFALMKVAKT